MNRDLKLDSLKGILIVLVLYGHIPFTFFLIEKTILLSGISTFIYFFHMPLFLAVSVLFIKTDFYWLLKRASLILLPYLFWFFYANKRLLIENPIEFMGGAMMGNWESLHSIIWFLPALFSLNFLFFIFYKGTKLVKTILLLGSILAFTFASYIIQIHNLIPFGMDIAIYLFILVHIIKRIYENQNIIEKLNIPLLLVIIIISATLLFNYEPIKTHTQYHAIIDLAQFSVPITSIGYVSFLILNISIFSLFLKFRSSRILSLIGIYAFPIFLLHLMILYKLPKLIQVENFGLNILFLLLTFLLSIVMPIIISKLLMRVTDKFKYIGMVK
jgi:fucose 4-O-acetylase-like acetyltransferase